VLYYIDGFITWVVTQTKISNLIAQVSHHNID